MILILPPPDDGWSHGLKWALFARVYQFVNREPHYRRVNLITSFAPILSVRIARRTTYMSCWIQRLHTHTHSAVSRQCNRDDFLLPSCGCNVKIDTHADARTKSMWFCYLFYLTYLKCHIYVGGIYNIYAHFSFVSQFRAEHEILIAIKKIANSISFVLFCLIRCVKRNVFSFHEM